MTVSPAIRGRTAPLSIAPMMDHTDRHYRWMMRQLTRHTLLYTEMVVSHALIHGDRDRFLAYDPVEHPVSLQLGGDDPVAMAECARIAADHGYDEVNINVGCPSDRVKSGCFGAVLMRDPDQVARVVEAMRGAVDLPVTVKHRIGVDELDRYEDMLRFVDGVAAAGADRFTVHARKAWLQGLSPKENRTIPPLRYPDVWRLKAERPHLPIEINGGIRTLDQAGGQLDHVDAVMIGRAATDDPWIFRDADARFFAALPADPTLVADRRELVARVQERARREATTGERPWRVIRHLLSLFNGEPGARAFRRVLSDQRAVERAGAEVLTEALAAMDDTADRRSA
ncbi:MAG: tRNA dihydrouridine(20/20a) synthase DusA [Alphaproteobacteria bacterium]|nr:tRNA dihydrouridine(20/20a) synthase DusA [Alphaproteobacteria bacterium]